MADIIPIHPEPNEKLVELLEKMLKEAKNGSIQGIAYAALFEDGCSDNGWAWVDDGSMITHLLGEVSLLRAEIEDGILDTNIDNTS